MASTKARLLKHDLGFGPPQDRLKRREIAKNCLKLPNIAWNRLKQIA